MASPHSRHRYARRRTLLHLAVICTSLCGVAPWLLVCCPGNAWTNYSRAGGSPARAGEPPALLALYGHLPVAALRRPPPQSVPPTPTYRDFDSARALRDACHLAVNIGPRPGGSAGERAAAEWLCGQLREMGYQVRRQSGVRLAGRRGLKTQNLIATLPGKSHGPRLLIGAHMDSYPRPGCTGANDNASGVAVTLELARLLVRADVPYSFQIVFFGAEECQGGRSLVGSNAFVAAARGSLPAAMICVDMVGRGERLHLWHTGGGNRRLIKLCKGSAGRLGMDLRTGRRSGGSDHVPFAAAGVPAVWLQRLPDGVQHTAGDRAERLQETALTETGRLLAHVLLSATAVGQWP